MFGRMMAGNGHVLHPGRPAQQQTLDQAHQKEERNQRAVPQGDDQGDGAMDNLRGARPGEHCKNHRWIMAQV